MQAVCPQKELTEGLGTTLFLSLQSRVFCFFLNRTEYLTSQINASQYIGYFSLAVLSSQVF